MAQSATRAESVSGQRDVLQLDVVARLRYAVLYRGNVIAVHAYQVGMHTRHCNIYLTFRFRRHPQLIRRLVRVLLCGNIVYTVLLFVFLNVPNTVEDGYSIGDWVYTNPLVRISSYLIGGIYGYAHAYSLEAPFETLFATKTAKCELAGFTLWLFAQMRNMELVSPVVVGSIVVVLRSLLSAATAHLIFCSFRIEGSYRVTRWVVRFLESSWFQRLSRITYAIYLLNPTTILHVYYSLSEAMPSDFSILVSLSCKQ